MNNIRIIEKWMGNISLHISHIKKHEATISKRQLLRILYRIGDDAATATHEINREIENVRQTNEKMQRQGPSEAELAGETQERTAS